MKRINVAKDFSKYPAGRYVRNGSTSGEAFRERFLVPALQAQDKVVVELDGVIGYGSSFLEEAFGGSVRRTGLAPSEVLQLVEIATSDDALREEITRYIVDAAETSQRKQ